MSESFAGITVPEGEPAELRSAGQTFAGISGALEGVSSELGALPGMLSAWQGPASVNFAGSILTNETALDSGSEALQSASLAASRYADELEQAQDDARAAIEGAREAQKRIDRAEADIEAAQGRAATATGSFAVASARVVATGMTGAPSADALADQSAAEAAIADAQADEARARRELEQAQEDLRRAQEAGRRAEEAARDAAQAVAGAFGIAGASSPAMAVFGAPGSAVAGGGAAPVLVGGRLYVGGRSLAVSDASPAEVAAFFESIGPSQGREVANAYPALIGPLNGAPYGLRFTANRALAAQEVGRLQDELAAVNSEFEEDDDGGLFLPIAMIRPAFGLFSKDRDEVLEERRAELEDQLETMRPFTDENRQLLVFDPRGDGRIAEAFGDLERSGNVSVFVPGIGNDISNFDGENRSEVLRVHEQASRLSGGDAATIAWLDYESPDGFTDPATFQNDNAAEGAESLSQLMAGIDARSPEAHTAVFGHSYGSVVVGQSAANYGLSADEVALTGSPGPGPGVDSASDLMGSDPGRRVWVGETPNDLIAEPPAFDGIHGPDPAEPGFGARRFDTGPPLEPLQPLIEIEHVDVPVPDVDVKGVEVPVVRPGFPFPSVEHVRVPVPVPGVDSASVPYPEPHPEAIDDDVRILADRHTTDYFDPRTEAFKNISRIASGRGDEVPLVGR